ncbi:YifB family Mg chelatase-like AAA ATPase [Rugamonas rivuli]|uniref:YifB family Mg chelatase-like AAA ATPase n=1 Tax=Rugamonas rivuli TaxID=2743358 RepID=A0A843SED7_9BURK|nr:YifB family Mg chelatase-like AAA ATPase [Rugamonas rivuli]MQA20828.1 YifB family Mg chelatase-like AAA ATPase [Rugamonas rivuli]
MSLAVLKSRALAGMEAQEVSVEVHLANGLPAFTIVGLADTEVKEAKDRVRAAIQNGGFEFPAQRITVNLAPADLPKESGRFDLPIALGILAASKQIPSSRLHQYEFAGELSLSGELRPIRGALAMSLATRRDGGTLAFILPLANADEAALVGNAAIYPAQSLLQVCGHFAAKSVESMLSRHESAPLVAQLEYPDFADVKGQVFVKRALEVAAAGNHSILLVGPPGAGKTMLAARFAGLLPEMTDEEALEAAAVQSLTGNFRIEHWKRRPFRSPHHTSSGVALVGGGSVPRPGEISLAHRGVLFLDELPEFARSVLDVLREPMESGRITISRAARQADFPAHFQLIAAMNPCPCGYLGHTSGLCHCSPDLIQRYQGRVSGPLLDRIDIQMEVAAVDPEILAADADGESSRTIAARVQAATDIQLQRQGKRNQYLSTREIDQYCKPDRPGKAQLKQSMQHFQWSGRAYHRILRVARTIADLAGSERILLAHVSEAIQYRQALRKR